MEQMKTPPSQESQEAMEILMELGISHGEVNEICIEKQIQADRVLAKVGKLRAEIVDLEGLKREAIQFYDYRIDKVNKTISHLEGLLEVFTRNHGKTIRVPSGSLKLYKNTKYVYPEPAVLVEFSKANNIPLIIKELPNKTEIKKYIKATGEAPEGYDEIEEVRFKASYERGI